MHLGYCIKVRGHCPNHFNRAYPVHEGDHFFFIDSFFPRPQAPSTIHRARGIDQHTIEIEKNG